jgi:hypothetical protein
MLHIRVRILLYVSSYYYVSVYVCVSSYYDTCVLMLHIRDRILLYVSSYYYVSAYYDMHPRACVRPEGPQL